MHGGENEQQGYSPLHAKISRPGKASTNPIRMPQPVRIAEKRIYLDHSCPRRPPAGPNGQQNAWGNSSPCQDEERGGMHGAAPSRAQVVSTLGNPSKRRAPQCKLSQYGPCNSECHRGRVARSTGVGHCTQQIPASSVPKEQRPRPAAPLNEVVVCVTASAPPAPRMTIGRPAGQGGPSKAGNLGGDICGPTPTPPSPQR